jgi:hypothetical protein
MFERLAKRVQGRAEARARERSQALAAQLRGELPPGVDARAGEAEIVLSGRALRRRFALERELLWLVARLK